MNDSDQLFSPASRPVSVDRRIFSDSVTDVRLPAVTNVSPIPVISGRRRRTAYSQRRNCCSVRYRYLKQVNLVCSDVHSLSPGDSSLSLFIVNACSLAKNNNFQLLQTEILALDVDVVAVSESWLKSKHLDALFSIPGYHLYRLDRVGCRGGGVCVYVKDCLLSSVVYTSSHIQCLCLKHEILWLKICKCGINYILGTLYHPPRPAYNVNSFLDRLSSDIDEIMSLHSDSILYLTGDLNRLPVVKLASDNGLTQVVTDCTRGSSVLDMFLTNRPDTVNVTVAKTAVKTDHRALLVNVAAISSSVHDGISFSSQTSKRRVSFYDIREQNIVSLFKAVSECDWSSVFKETDIDIAYQSFLDKVKCYIDQCIPCHFVTVSNSTPPYVTPLVKCLLRKRNKLMRKGLKMKADTLTAKIGKLIKDFRSNCLLNVDSSSSSKLWKIVNSARGHVKVRNPLLVDNKLVDPNELNQYFAGIATDNEYDCDSVNDIIESVSSHNQSQTQNTPCTPVALYDVQNMLRKCKKTAPGLDNVPYWFFRECWFLVAPVVTYLFNLSLRSGCPPVHWKKSVISPVPKTAKPSSFSDLRPISVTPILSRLFERCLVRNYILPFIPEDDLQDQFAYRFTGSTTSALINTFHHITHMLDDNDFVRCIFVDYSKAFDCVDHLLLFKKLLKLPLKSNVILWLMNFLQSRSQAVMCNGQLSDFLFINRSIVQGSGVGPVLFIIFAADLRTLSTLNIVSKYADDTTLISPQNADICITAEFSNLVTWSECNKLAINFSKTKELVFRKPCVRSLILPDCITGVERVDEFKLLGVLVTSSLSMDRYIDVILSIVTQRFYLLSQLKSQGLSINVLNILFHALIVSRIVYALPAFSGFLSEYNRSRINSIFKKGRKWRITDLSFNIEELIESSDQDLFRKVQNSFHCLSPLLPPSNPANDRFNLRPRGHDLSLPSFKKALFKNSFIIRALYKYK